MLERGGFTAKVGSGTVAPSVFVDLLSGEPYQVTQSVVSSYPIGISQMGTRYAPTEENSALTYAGKYTGTAGETGDDIQVFDEACRGVYLTLGTTVTARERLRPDADGKGVPAVTGIAYGAIAEEDGVAGNLIRVRVHIGKE